MPQDHPIPILPGTMQSSPPQGQPTAAVHSTPNPTPEPPSAADRSAPVPPRVDRNWARVRQKMIGSESILQTGQATANSRTDLPSSNGNTSALRSSTDSNHPKPAPRSSAIIPEQPKSTYPPMEGSGPVSTGLRGVLGFRTVVLQRTQLRKMEKEIEKALSRHINDQNQPRARTVARIGTGARGMISGNTYNLMAMQQETTSADRALVDELADILNRWKALIVEVPCKADILKTLAKMLLADRAEPLSRADSTAVLNLFDQMRRMFPLHIDPDNLQDVLWCLDLLSQRYACKKERVIAIARELLSPKVCSATWPLSPKNIHVLLSALIALASEQAKLPEASMDQSLLAFISETMERIRTGDLGIGKVMGSERPLQEHLAQIAFLRGLIECLRMRDLSVVHYLLHEMIPKYWMEPVSKYSMAMDGPVRLLGQAASEIVLNAPVAYADGSDLSKALILDLVLFIQEFLPPAGLSGAVSGEAIAMLIKFVLTVFSAEFPESPQQAKVSVERPRTSKEGQEDSPRVSTSSDVDTELHPRTPPRSPMSPNASSENFQSSSLPSQPPNIALDEQLNPVMRHARTYLDGLWQHGYQDAICEGVKSEKMVVHQPEPSERLSVLLLQLSIQHRAAFFKPMIACVASDSTQFVTDYLCILSCLETHLGLVDLYMKDADMICVIAMTDVGAERPRPGFQTQALRWGSCTLGQCIILLEFIYAIKRLAKGGDNHETEIGKMFLIDLERKLGLYLVSKEKRTLVPRPIRIMLCLIFYEIRMLCKTIHRPGWLSRILDWATNLDLPSEGGAHGGSSGISETMRLRIRHIYSSVDGLLGEQRDRYSIKIDSSNGMSTKGSPKLSTHSSKMGSSHDGTKGYSQRRRTGRIPDVRLDETVTVLMLLITVHSAIHASEYLTLIEPLWNVYCLESRPKVTSLCAFLFVKCADIAPKTIYSLVSRDLTSEDPYTRLSAVERLNVLFDHRNELLSQPYVIDPSSRGPFRNATIQVPFVISEVGSNRYTMDEPRWLTELKNAGNFPPDIRNRFRESGWGDEDQQEIEMTRRAQTPLMLSWTGYLDADYENKANFGRTYTVLPKDRHATVLIPVLNSLNLGTIDLLNDKAIGVRAAVIHFLSDYMRNEPVLFVRSFFSEIVHARPDRQRDLVSRLHMLLSYSSRLPAAFAYALFNHLLGLLKWFQRNSKPLGFEMLTIILPLLADVVSSTNDIVFKDFKRNKVDVFFAALGRFWFKPHIIPDSMFPNRLTAPDQVLARLGVPQQLFKMTLININQIQFMTMFLYRYPLEEPDIKASIGRFSRMPRLDATDAATTGPKLEDSQYLPDTSATQARFIAALPSQNRSLRSLSSLRARVWLHFAHNMVQKTDKKSAERLVLMNILNGVNVILLEHGNDLAIVGQALDLYVTAATRLRRFFSSQNGYGLFFCALFKTYCDSARIVAIRETIDAAFYRFYLLHQEAFVLQSLGAIVPLMLRNMSSEQCDIMAKGLFAFLAALDNPTTTYHSKALGVQSLSETYHERSTYGGPQLEIPQWISSLIPKDSKLLQSSNVLQKREFSIADSIKLFLSVIAYDPGSLRSEQFVRVLQQLLPFFLEKEPTLVTSGLDSLIEIFARFARSSKPLVPPSFVPPAVAPREKQDTEDSMCDISRFALFPSPRSKIQAIKGKTWAQNDRVAVKHEFICLVQLFCDHGGQLADVQHQQMATLVRSIVKDYTLLKIPCTTEWIKDYLRSVVLPIRNPQHCSRAAIYVIAQFAHALRSQYKVVDFSGFLNGLALIVEDDRQLLRSSTELPIAFRERVANPALMAAVKGDWAVESSHISQARFCSSVVDLVLAMINNADTDILAELEQTTPTPRFMAYIVIPLCLRFKTRFHANCLDILEMQFWLRLLGLTVKAAEFDPASRRTSRTAGLFAPMLNAARATRKRASIDISTPVSPQQQQPPLSAFLAPPSAGLSPQTPIQARMPSLQINDHDHDHDYDYEMEASQARQECPMNASPGLIVDFIALRIIMVRGERYLSYHPGCWLDIFNIIKNYFSAHASVGSSLTGTGAPRLNSASNGSGPSSPNILSTPFPATPRAEGPMTPRQSIGGFTSFPSFMRSSGEMTPFPGSTHTKENQPATALGYILWSFAETIIFNRLPLMIMMRPFLLDQLRLLDLQPQASSIRQSRSTGSSGANSPAFYWPSPSFTSERQFGSNPSPAASPQRLRADHGQSVNVPSQDSATAQRKQRDERRKQWRSWSKPAQPAQTMLALSAMEEPMRVFEASPMPSRLSPSRGHQRQRSFVSMSEQSSGAGPNNTPRISIHHPRSQRNQRSDAGSKGAEQALPKVLADRANRSMEHVRIMMNTSSDGMTAFSESGVPMYPERRAGSSGLSPSMAVHGDRRESGLPSTSESSHSNDHPQFLLPGKYERQPVSPGFGSMFLAREAALRAPSSSLPDVVSPASPSLPQNTPSLSLTVPSSSPTTVRSLPSHNGPRDSVGDMQRPDFGDENPYFTAAHPLSSSRGAEHPSLPGVSAENSTLSPTSDVVGGLSSRKGRSILKRIITMPPPKLEPIAQLEAAAELTPTGAHSPGVFDRQGMQSSRPTHSRATDEGTSTSAISGRRSSLSFHDLLDHRLACLRARTKIFLQNVEEETRLVLSSFPFEFSIGTTSLPTVNPPVTTSAPSTPQPVADGKNTAANDSSPLTGLAQYPEGEQLDLNDNARPRQNPPSLTVPTRRTPSITIQDQFYLTPSPIHPLPSAVSGGDDLFRTSLERAEEKDKVPFLLGSPPPSTAKERRSKSVLFSRQRSMDYAAGDHSSNILNPTPAQPLPSQPKGSSHPVSPINTLPGFSITESSPPMLSSSSFSSTPTSLPFSPPLPGHSPVALPSHTTPPPPAAAAAAVGPTRPSGHPALSVHFSTPERALNPSASASSVPEPHLIPELRVFTPGTSPSVDRDNDPDHNQIQSQSQRQDAGQESIPSSPPVPYNVIGLGVRNAGPAQESND
ncbi:hypothetical protein BGZ72_003631 [Mortierella alpina]|nr:hypothetical protein BGZ72_003631 [Mortierella alpina]